MTPDLERAAKIAFQAQCDVLGLPFDQAAADNTPTTDGLRAALRALLDPSPEVVSAMAEAAWNSDECWRWSDPRIVHDVREDTRKAALASWRAGLNAILAAEGK